MSIEYIFTGPIIVFFLKFKFFVYKLGHFLETAYCFINITKIEVVFVNIFMLLDCILQCKSDLLIIS